jgi:hypothetical protein
MADSTLDSEPAAAAKKAAATAATAALVGGLAGAAKALFDRRAAADENDDDDDDRTQGEPEDEVEDEPDNDDEPDDNDEPEDEPEDEAEHEADDEPEPTAAAPNGVAGSTAAEIVGGARRHLRELLGAEPESVSGVRRENGHWRVRLEVVDIHRIPESTDVLSSYDVVVDEDGGLVEIDRGRRYRRSQVDES